MKRVSVEVAFAWAQRFWAREWRLILPVAFAFVAIPQLLYDVGVPDSVWKGIQPAPGALPTPAAMRTMAWLFPVSVAVLLVAMAGGLAVTALAIIPRISVQEAIGLALRRLGTVVVAIMMLLAGIFVFALAAAVLLGFTHLDILSMQGVLFGVILGAGLFASTRLMPLAPLMIERRLGPVAAIRMSWELTHGAFWRLLVALLLYLVGALIILLALGTALSATLIVFTSLLGSPETGTIFNHVILRGSAAVLSAGFHLVVVGLYRQLTSKGI